MPLDTAYSTTSTPARRATTTEMTPPQREIWFAESLGQDATALMVSEVTFLEGPLDVERWTWAATAMLTETAAVRLRVVPDPSRDVPLLAFDGEPPAVDVVDLRTHPDPEASARAWLQEALTVPSDLERSVVSHATLLLTGEDRAQWFLRVHHLAMDGYAFSLLARGLAVRYAGEGTTATGRPDVTAYLEGVAGLHEDSETLSTAREYWAGREPVEEIRPLAPRARSAVAQRRTLDDESGGRTINPVVLLGTLALSAMAVNRKDEAVVGVHLMARTDGRSLGTVCTAQNLVPVTIGAHPEESVAEYLDRVSEAWAGASAHQSYRQERLRADRAVAVEEPLTEVDLNIVPFNGMMSYGGVEGRSIPVWDGPTEGMTLDVRAGLAGRVDMTLLAPEGSLSDAEMAGLAEMVGTLHDALTAAARARHDPVPGAVRLRDLALSAQGTISSPREGVLDQRNRWTAVHEMDGVAALTVLDAIRCLHSPSTLAEGAEPGMLAGPDGAMNRAEAASRVHRLARFLRSMGVGARDRVALAMPRHTWGVLAPLAVLESGASFVPLDVEGPATRRDAMIEAAAPRMVLGLGDAPADCGVEWIDLESGPVVRALADQDPAPLGDEERDGTVSPDDVAYILFTSGSTGRPKGVVVEHANLSHFLRIVAGLYLPACRLAAGAQELASVHEYSFAFDSGLSPLCAFLAGNALHIPSDAELRDPRKHLEYLRTHEIDVVGISPAVLDELLEHGFSPENPEGPDRVSAVFIGGDTCSPALWQRLRAMGEAGLLTANAYGPTENTVDSTVAWIVDSDTPSIGRSMPGQRARVTDRWGRECPAGVAGELVVSGASVARGYLDQPEATRRAFGLDGAGERSYRTGDLVRREPNGALTFLGRVDRQLSVRGVRIEPGEVEEALLELPGVRQAVADIRDDGRGPRLIGYVVRDAEIDGTDRRALTDALREALPPAMVPNTLVRLDALPLTERGKVDRRRLPAPAEDSTEGRPFADMRDTERRVAGVFAEVLGLDAEELTTGSDLFALGGHSLTAARVVGRLNAWDGQAPRYTLALKEIFEAPTVGELARRWGAPDRKLEGADAPGVETTRDGDTTRDNDATRDGDVTRDAGTSPEAAGGPDALELTAAQSRLWVIEQMEGPSGLYAIPMLMRLRHELDESALAEALVDTVMRYPSLHHTYPADESGRPGPVAWTREEVENEVSILALARSADDPDLMNAVDPVFDVARELPIRVYRTVADARCGGEGGDPGALVVVVHHLAADGWSMGPLFATLSIAYRARAAGRRPDLPPQRWVAPRPVASEDSLAWWVDALAGMPPDIALPSDRERPSTRDHRGGEVRRRVPTELIRRVHEVTRELRATPHMLMQTVLAALLTRTGAGTDIPIGTISSGRSTVEEEDLVAFVANTVVTRTDTSDNPRFVDLLTAVRDRTLDMLARGEVPFDDVVHAVNPARSPERHPLFQVMLVSQNLEDHAPEFARRVETLGTGTAKFDLTCEVSYGRDGQGEEVLGLRFEYATDIFDHRTVEDFADWFLALLTRAVEDPASRIGDAPLDARAVASARAEARRMVTERARAVATGDAAKTLTDAVERAFHEHAERIAVIEPGAPGNSTSGRRVITYAELDRESARIRDGLRGLGLGPGDRVALMLPRSARQVVAMLGAVRAGVAYIPLDPGYPLDRLSVTLEDGDPAAVLYSADPECAEPVEALRGRGRGPAFYDIAFLGAPDGTPRCSDAPCPEPVRDPRPEDTAYVIFTSGSTGRPKGVAIPQSNVVRLFGATDRWFGFGPGDTWTLFHSFAFDFAVWEMFGALLHGGSLVIVPQSVSRSPEEFLELLITERVTMLNQTPSAFAQLTLADADRGGDPTELALRWVVLGGEAMDPAVVSRWHDRRAPGKPRVVNMYGITETTVHVTYLPLGREIVGRSPVGEPIPDLSLYLLDDFGHPVPDGVVGEIHVGGAGVAAGYLGNPELTAQRFVPDPFAAEHSDLLDSEGPVAGTARMYASGDLAVRRRDGTLDFRGRADRQVQLRGFRIELGDVEAAALALEDVEWAHASVEAQGSRDERLVLHVLGPDPATTDPLDIRRRVASALPAQMAPAGVVVLTEVPLTGNGKLDVGALPAAAVRSSRGRAPEGETERAICTAFAQTLGLDRVSAEDSFFDLGGHSMLAVTLAARLREVMGPDIRVGTVMSHPTPELLARYAEAVELGDGAARDADLRVLLPLGRARDLTPSSRGAVFCVHPAGGLSWCYAGLPKFLPEDLPVWGLQARGVMDPEAQPGSLADMARDYVVAMREVQPEGPYHLVGWSLGGMVAHVMAALLQREGAEVGLVALLDAYPSEAETGVGEPPLVDAVSAVLAMAGFEDDELDGRFVTGQDAAPGPVVDTERDGEDLRTEAIGELDRILTEKDSPMAGLPRGTLGALVNTYRNTAKILREYAHETFDGEVVFFRAARAGIGPDHDPHEWDRYLSGGLRIIEVDCTHREMTQPGPLAVIGRVLVEELS